MIQILYIRTHFCTSLQIPFLKGSKTFDEMGVWILVRDKHKQNAKPRRVVNNDGDDAFVVVAVVVREFSCAD